MGFYTKKLKEAEKMTENRIWLSSPTMHGDEMKYINEAFEKNWVAPLGFNCDNFEKEMKAYLSQDNKDDVHTVALSSGTAAIHLALKLAGVKDGDIVFCSDMTFAATVNPVAYERAIPVFIDSERESWNMDPKALEKAFEKYPETKVVILVHLYGVPAKVDEIQKICEKHGTILIEDAAEALSATYKGKACGTFGQYGILSFNGNKIITTSGGGMLITKEEEDCKKAIFLATQAREDAPWYQHAVIGHNYRMSNIVAGIGRGQLPYLEEHRELKEKIYRRYQEGLKGLPVTLNPYLADTRPNFWLTCMTIVPECGVKFMDVIKKLADENIESRPIWKPMHMQPVFKESDFITAGDKAVDEEIFENGLCLPSDIKMTEEEQDRVIEIVRTCFEV